MALQIRRGTDAQRLSLSGVNLPVVGEPLFTTDTKKLYIGDGATTGGIALGYYGSIVVAGQGTLSANNNTDTLTLVAGSNITLTTDPTTDSVTIAAAATFTELKNESIRIFQNNIVGLNSNEDIVVNPSGTGKLDVVGNLSVSGTITGNVTGNLSGNVTGNVSGTAGSVTGQANSATTTASSTNTANQIVLRDASGNFSAGTITATLSGNVTGNVTGNVNGVVTGTAGSTLNGTVTGIFQTEKIRIIDDIITTMSSNENIIIDPAGTGSVVIPAYLKVERVEAIQNVVNGGIIVGNQNPTNGSFIIATAHDTATTTVAPGAVAPTGPMSGSTIILARARNGLLAPNAIQNGDEIATMDFAGYDGTNYQTSARIRTKIDGAVSSGQVPGKLEFMASNTSGTSDVRFTVSSTAVTAAVPMIVPSYTSTPDTRPTGSTGMIIFDTSTNKFQGFNGTTWSDLN